MTAAPEITQTVQVELVIGCMTCAACAARVQAKLNKVTGVTASVNLSTERAWVSAPPTISARDLVGVEHPGDVHHHGGSPISTARYSRILSESDAQRPDAGTALPPKYCE